MGHADSTALRPAPGTFRRSQDRNLSLNWMLASRRGDTGESYVSSGAKTGETAHNGAHAALADALIEQIAFLDATGTIVDTNKAWEAASEYGAASLSGESYMQSCLRRAAQGDADAIALADALRAMERGELSDFDHFDTGEGQQAGRTYHVRIRLLPPGDAYWAIVARYDVTNVVTLKRQKRRLSTLLLQAEEQERRRVARDLHDSTAQELVALQLNLAQLKRANNAKRSHAFVEIERTLERLQREIRGLSYLFHAPSVKDGGLCEGLEKMAVGFGHRTGLDIRLSLDRLAKTEPKVDGALYRLAQEALANVYRHAKATKVEIRLLRSERRLHFFISDNGVGLRRRADDPAPAGVGLAAMRERISEIGGCLVIHHSGHGTSIIASVPVTNPDLPEG